MANLKLKSNILDLVCRICLKLDKDRYNIFEHLNNKHLLANMIMELICIQVSLFCEDIILCYLIMDFPDRKR